MSSSLNSPVVGGKVSISLFIDHPKAQEVRISMPPTGNALQLDRVNTSSKRTASSMPDITVIEIIFIPQHSGAVTVEPIEVILPGRSIFTKSVSFFIKGNTEPAKKPVFRWDIPKRAIVGEQFEASLIFNGAFEDAFEDTIFYTALPEHIICEYKASTDTDKEKGVTARLLIIPLIETTITFAPREFQYKGQELVIPGFSMPVTGTLVNASYKSDEEASLQESDTVFDNSYDSIPRQKNRWEFAIGIVILVLALFFKKNRFRWRIVFICAGIAVCSVFIFLGSPKTLELYDVDLYRVPDSRSQINAHFDGGRTFTVRSEHEDWFYVEASDGRLGWIKAGGPAGAP